jgi:subtilisin family serine protease
MRFRGNTYTGKGVVVAVIDSGIDVNDPRMQGVKISGWSIQLTATGHAGLGSDFHDENGHGTDIAATILRMAPEVELVAIKIMDRRLYTSADLMAAGIETAHRHGAHIINLSAGTPNMGKSALLRDCCAMANEAGAVVLAAAHPKGERAYPADLPTSSTTSIPAASRRRSGAASARSSSRTASSRGTPSGGPSAARASPRRTSRGASAACGRRWARSARRPSSR